ncbi:MAG: hypothetical protein JRI23_06405 [Deltaproteobacteria bacterium]|jgi:hypothetical protein|nr:hypothetical protein [Deltaproteobacteria bacterium]MBW2531210.1 hypothetical protein [Deltaproteobacteria bacterium]
MKRSLTTLGAVLLCLGLLSVGCSKNEAATQKCRQAQDCAACCKQAGATGHASGTVNGKYSCKCLGGR